LVSFSHQQLHREHLVAASHMVLGISTAVEDWKASGGFSSLKGLSPSFPSFSSSSYYQIGQLEHDG
jgi:hypothetical protein